MQQNNNAELEAQWQACNTNLQTALVKLQQQVQQAEAIQRIVQVINALVELDEALQSSVDVLVETLQVHRCLILQPNCELGSVVRYTNQATLVPSNLMDAYCEIVSQHTPELIQGQPVVICNWEHRQLSLEIQQDYGVHSILIVPILTQQSYWGGILLHECNRGREWTDEEMAFVQTVANLCAIAISQAELAKAQQESQQQKIDILENITDGLFIFDQDWRFTYINPQAKALLQKTSDELLGQNVWEVYPYAVDTIVYQEYHRARREQVTVHFEVFSQNMNTWFEIHAYPTQNGLFVYFQDISERKQAEERLNQREQEFRALAENAPDIIARYDKQLRHLYVNAVVEPITGLSPQDHIGKTIQEIGMPEDLYTCWEENLQQVFTTGQERIIEFDFITLDGTRRYYQTRLVPEFALDGSVETILSIDRDITDFKQAEEQLKASLQEKEVLLKEVHHRVKNNLQIISSLLDLQSLQLQDPTVREAFRTSQNRVKSIALIHEKLYQSENLARVNLADYIHTLATFLLETYSINPNSITLQLKVDDIFLELDKAIPCGLIINELVTNALKHGFTGRTKGTIWVEAQAVRSESPQAKVTQFTLSVGNDGIKLQEPPNFTQKKSLGFQLVDVLVKQLKGQLEFDQSRGTEFKMQFSADCS